MFIVCSKQQAQNRAAEQYYIVIKVITIQRLKPEAYCVYTDSLLPERKGKSESAALQPEINGSPLS